MNGPNRNWRPKASTNQQLNPKQLNNEQHSIAMRGVNVNLLAINIAKGRIKADTAALALNAADTALVAS